MLLVGLTLIVVGLFTGAYWLFVGRTEKTENIELRKRLKLSTGPVAVTTSRLLKPLEHFSSVPVLNASLTRLRGISAPLQRDISQAGLTVSVSTVLLAAGCLAGAAFFAVTLLEFGAMVGIGAAVGASLVPFVLLRRARNKRLHKFEEQFPEAVDLLGRSLRAGHAFTTGVLMVAEEIPSPVGAEFKLLYDHQNFGMPFAEALRGFAARVPLIDARFFTTAVLTQRETGGNLGEVLDNLATVIRDRFKVKRQVQVLTAHGRITGWVLAGFPPALAGVMCLVAPQQMKLLVTDPLGVRMVVGAVILQVLGTVIINKLVKIPY